ncbi:MAG: hypothetical protein IPG17_06250 [Sandaracinaceae bacterium]|nr:hypothetical protein [Sandaracinaceae bacterium]
MRLVPYLRVPEQAIGHRVLKIARDISQRRHVGGNMQSLGVDSQYRVELGHIVQTRQSVSAKCLAVVYLADALLAELTGDPSALDAAMEEADRSLAMLDL